MAREILPPDRPEAVPEDYGRSGSLNFLSSGVGPMMAAFFTNPMEVAKVRVQMDKLRPAGSPPPTTRAL